MKKHLKLLAILIIAILITAALASCANEGDGEDNESYNIAISVLYSENNADITIYTEKDNSVLKEFSLTLEAEFLADIIEEINLSFEQNKLTFNVASGYIESLKYEGETYGNGTTGPYVMIYCSLNDEAYADSFYTYTFNGTEYNSAALGIEELPAIDETTYLFVLQSF